MPVWWTTAVPFDPSDGVVWMLVFVLVNALASRATTERQRRAIPFVAGALAVVIRATADVVLAAWDAQTFAGINGGTFLRAVATWGTVVLRHVLQRQFEKARTPPATGAGAGVAPESVAPETPDATPFLVAAPPRRLVVRPRPGETQAQPEPLPRRVR